MSSKAATPAPASEETMLQAYGEQKHNTNETAIAAVEAEARAAIQARYLLANAKPRDLDKVRESLLKECKRPAFAATARWSKKRGDSTISGLSIRFAEAALRCYTNIYAPQSVIYDDVEKRIVKLSVIDLECNVSYDSAMTLAKEIERRSAAKGAEILRQRVGASGQRLYILRATDDEILDRQNALISKALRTQGLRHIPGWLLDEAEEVLVKTASDQAAKDPDAERRKLFDAFAQVGIGIEDLKAWAGHDMKRLDPAELVELRGLYQGIKDGQFTFDEALEARGGKGRGSKAEAKAKEAVEKAG